MSIIVYMGMISRVSHLRSRISHYVDYLVEGIARTTSHAGLQPGQADEKSENKQLPHKAAFLSQQ